jgi:hypothetical protein
MAALKWVIVCERAIVEEQVKALSIIAVMEQVRVRPSATLPPVPSGKERPALLAHRFTIVQFWTRSDPAIPETCESRTILYDTRGKQFAVITNPVDLVRFKSLRSIAAAPGFPWTGPGVVRMSVELKAGSRWRKVGSTEVEIVIDAKPAADSLAH